MKNENSQAGQLVPVQIVKNEGSTLPLYATEQSAGCDLCADLRRYNLEELTLHPGAWALIPTGLFIQLPPGYEAQIRPRSGLALKHGVTVLNAPGTIDADYRGEIGVLLVNHSATPFEIKPGDRIAQMVISPYCRAEWQAVEALDSSSRGAGGFGSTGK